MAEPLSGFGPFQRLADLVNQSEDWKHFDTTDAKLLVRLLREREELSEAARELIAANESYPAPGHWERHSAAFDRLRSLSSSPHPTDNQ